MALPNPGATPFAVWMGTVVLLATFNDFPPRQRPSFTIDQAMENLDAGITSV